jgi:hypothetical protein
VSLFIGQLGATLHQAQVGCSPHIQTGGIKRILHIWLSIPEADQSYADEMQKSSRGVTSQSGSSANTLSQILRASPLVVAALATADVIFFPC